MSKFFRPIWHAWLRPYRALGAFSLLWTLILALGIAVCAVCYTQIEQTVLQPLDFPEQEQLAVVQRVQGMCQSCPLTAPLWRDVMALLPNTAGSTQQAQRLSGSGLSARNIGFSSVTPNFFEVFGKPAIVGRLLHAQDADTDTVVISEQLWREVFDASPSVIGRAVVVGKQPKVVVGVVSAAFHRVARNDVFGASRFADADDGSNFLDVITRLEPGLPEAALAGKLQSALQTAAKRSPENYGASDYRLSPMSLLESRMQRLRTMLMPVFAIIVLLALLMAANASSLFAVTVLERINALMTELALGAHRTRLMGGVALQAINLTLTAAVIAALMGPALFELTRRYLVVGMQTLQAVQFSYSTLAVVVLVFAALNVIAGVLPAWLILRNNQLNQSERTQVSGTGKRFGKIALGLQLIGATSVVMLSLLLVRTLDKVNAVDPGFDTTRIWTAKLILPNMVESEAEKNATINQNEAFLSKLHQAVQQIPGVSSVAFAGDIPLGEQSWNNGDFVVPGAQGLDANNPPYAQFRPISGEYAKALGIHVVSGRLPQWQPAGELEEAAVNQAYVDRFMPGIDPVGRVLVDRKIRIVGVLQNVKQAGLAEAVEPDVYASFSTFYWYTKGQLIVKSAIAVDPTRSAQLFEQIRAAVGKIDPGVPLYEPQSGTELRVHAARDITIMTRTLLLFAALALLTTALGLFGLCAFSVSRRRREFGLRLAVGARPAALTAEIVKNAISFSAVCAVLGLLVGYYLSDLIAAQLYGIERTDLISALGAITLILAISAIATLTPAWRATRIDPLLALRAD